MKKFFKVKAIFLLLLILLCGAFFMPTQNIVKAEHQTPTASVYYALVSLGYSQSDDKNSLVVEECIGVRLKDFNLGENDFSALTQNVYKEMKDFKQNIDALVQIKGLGSFIVVNDVKIDGDIIYVKLRYLNILSYYSFNNRPLPDVNAPIILYDKKENEGFYNKYYNYMNNPFGTKGAQEALNLFKNNYYTKVVNAINLTQSNFNIQYVFDYSTTDSRLYGDYESQYSITGINSNTIYVYEFVFNEDIPDTLSLYFVAFNQYYWYAVAIGITLIVIGALYVIIFINGKKKKSVNI